MSATAASSSAMDTGRFSHARTMPLSTLLRSNVWRLPSFFTTTMGRLSTVSYVVNRFPHDRHSRRRRMLRPSSEWRESTTLLSW